MKSIEQVATSLRQGRPLPSESRLDASSLPPDHPMWELWQRMTEMYGHRWTSQQGEEPNDTWLRGLRDLQPKSLGHGLVACRDSASGWPPTLPEFRAMCVPDHGLTAIERSAHRMFQPTALEDITAKERRREQGIKEISRLREEVGL